MLQFTKLEKLLFYIQLSIKFSFTSTTKDVCWAFLLYLQTVSLSKAPTSTFLAIHVLIVEGTREAAPPE